MIVRIATAVFSLRTLHVISAFGEFIVVFPFIPLYSSLFAMFLCVYISLFTSCLCAASCVINDDDDDDEIVCQLNAVFTSFACIKRTVDNIDFIPFLLCCYDEVLTPPIEAEEVLCFWVVRPCFYASVRPGVRSFITLSCEPLDGISPNFD